VIKIASIRISKISAKLKKETPKNNPRVPKTNDVNTSFNEL
jgi:hypothetical protein